LPPARAAISTPPRVPPFRHGGAQPRYRVVDLGHPADADDADDLALYIAIEIGMVYLLYFVPQLTLYLPSQMAFH
jgi:hypothetical protein